MNDSSKMMTRTGQCSCGAIKFTVSGPPINVRACHCRDCQRVTGSAFFVRALFPKSQVKISGKPAGFHSSDDVTREFCPHCGSHIFVERKSRPDAIAIALGTFDNLEGISPTEHFWVSDRQPWVSIPDKVSQYEES
jgi:hypothetical protein